MTTTSKKLHNKAYVVAVDLDGVLAQFEKWEGWENIGDPIEGAKEFMDWLAEFSEIIIHTSRLNIRLNKGISQSDIVMVLKNWLDKHDIPYDSLWTDEGKPYGNFYIDDRAVVCRPQEDKFSYKNSRAEITKRIYFRDEMRED